LQQQLAILNAQDRIYSY